ncbi:hypothetical protein [Tepidibacter aestuarii]|uniref:hypothetical protein n=1 Tax=Tepidibacter aestuarii TaxID=2925782 RepID=UPI0020BF4FC8|nr:hypothetical protein [Tepidibacter aestuarii]
MNRYELIKIPIKGIVSVKNIEVNNAAFIEYLFLKAIIPIRKPSNILTIKNMLKEELPIPIVLKDKLDNPPTSEP